MTEEENNWEWVTLNTWRLKVDGGHLYHIEGVKERSLCFVPEIDLTRYQSHLRDAYTQGYKDGQEDAKKGVKQDEYLEHPIDRSLPPGLKLNNCT